MFGRPRAATGADVTLSSETMLSLPMRVHDRALFGTWRTQYDEQNPAPKADKPGRAARVWRQEKPFTLPDASPKLMWRLMRMYRDVCALCQNERGVCFATNKYFADNYSRGHKDRRTEAGTFAPASEATVRRWIALLVEHGWIGSEVCGPDRTLWPLIHPSTLLKVESLRSLAKDFFERHFKRLLTATLNALTPSLLIVDPDKGSTKNIANRPAKYQKKEPLSVDLSVSQQEVVAAIASQFGVDTDWLTGFVTKSEKAVQALWDALDITRWAKSQDKLKFNAAGYLRNWAEGLLSGKRTLPGAVIAVREAEIVRRERAARDEQTVAQAEAAKAERDATAAADKARRAEVKRAEETAAAREREQSIPAPLRAPWEAVRAALEPKPEDTANLINKPSWETHIRPLLPVRMEGDTLVLGAPSLFTRDWVEKRFLAPLREAFAREMGRERLTVRVELLRKAG